MSSPPVHIERQANFTDHSTAHPDEPQSGVDLDAEFDAEQAVINKIIDRLAEIQRSDGKLKNGIVTPDSLSTELTLGFDAPSPWAAGTDYAPPQTVFYDAKFYIVKTAHTSTDTFDASKFSLIADLGSGAIEAAASALAAAASATAALNAQIAAEAARDDAEAAAEAAAAFDSSLYLTKAGNGAGIADPDAFRTAIGVRVGTLKIFSGGSDPAASAEAGDIWAG